MRDKVALLNIVESELSRVKAGGHGAKDAGKGRIYSFVCFGTPLTREDYPGPLSSLLQPNGHDYSTCRALTELSLADTVHDLSGPCLHLTVTKVALTREGNEPASTGVSYIGLP
jgi:hypothetical protein